MAKRNFAFTWHENVKYGKPIIRQSAIEIPNASTDSGMAAKAAVEIFTKNFGNLKHNTIVSIQEYDEGGPVGEPIIPNDENSIVPLKK